MKNLLLICMLLCSAALAYAQSVDDVIELLKSDIKNNRKQVITETMAFSEPESKKFWPIYRDYEYELEKLSDIRVGILKELASHNDTVSSKKAEELMNNYFAFLDKRIKLNKKYFAKFMKVLSPATAVKYMQLENEFQLLTDVQVVEILPYVKVQKK